MRTEILYEDRDVLVIYKPAGLAVQTAKLGQQDVVSELKNYLCWTEKASPTVEGKTSTVQKESPTVEGKISTVQKEILTVQEEIRTGREKAAPYLGIVHRLDQPVEGVLAFAKNKKAAASLAGQVQNREDDDTLCKCYYAVFYGQPPAKEGELTDYLYKNRENKAVVVEGRMGARALEEREAPLRRTKSELSKASLAVLRYRILELQEERGIGLAEIRLVTGRFHQIRAQMAHAGMPLLGDQKYGDEASGRAAETLGIRNVALCACELEFSHPASKERMHFQVKPRGKIFSFFSQL